MPHAELAHIPSHKPKSLHIFLRLATRAWFPKNNDRRMARIFNLLSQRRTLNDGWVKREELISFWRSTNRKRVGIERKPSSSAFKNAMDDLGANIHHTLGWILPHFSMRLEANSKKHATAYRLVISRTSDPWDFVDNEAPHTNPVEFDYRFNNGPRHRVKMQVWPQPGTCRHLEIVPDREPPKAVWVPPSHAKEYHAVREKFFKEQSAARKASGLKELHQGELWGIKEVVSAGDADSMSLRIPTARIAFQDYFFLSRNLDQDFEALRKKTTFRQWLELDQDPRDGFYPPCDALCVAVLIVTRKPKLTMFVAKQKPAKTGSNPTWEVSAAGAASSSQVHHHEEKPDLNNQMHGVVARETGIKFKDSEVHWLGFARSVVRGNSSAIALIESPHTAPEIRRQFLGRREQDDVDDLVPVELSKAHEWLATIPPHERCEFLELTIALAGIHYKLAHVC